MTTTTTTRWWLIRHAPVINPTGMIYGQFDVEADCSHRPPFAALATGLPTRAATMVTPLRRTVQTLETIRAHHTLSVTWPAAVVEADLIEQHFGTWQGMSNAEVNASRSGPFARFWLAPADERPPGGESFIQLVDRVRAALTRQTEQHMGHDIVAVAHGGTIRAAISVALGIDPETALQFKVDNLSVTRLDHIAPVHADPVWRVITVNAPPEGCQAIAR